MRREPAAIYLGDRRIAADRPPFVIAEVGINHGGSTERALALVEAAAGAGADAVKLQTITATALVGPACPAPAHVCATSLVTFFSQFELDEDAHHVVRRRASNLGLRFLSTPFSEPAVDMLMRVGVDAFKIASGDLTWDALIARCAATGRPLVLSTGMAEIDDVRRALAVARAAGAIDVALLHCVSAYPVPGGSENLRAISTLAAEFGVPVGLSDHGRDASAFPLAVALGASIYERHVMLDGDTDADAIDAAVSSGSTDLAAAIGLARRAWRALGSGEKTCLPVEAVNREASRRSLCAARDLSEGAVLTSHDLVALRPARGVPPGDLDRLCGARLRQAVRRGDPIRYDLVSLVSPETDCVA